MDPWDDDDASDSVGKWIVDGFPIDVGGYALLAFFAAIILQGLYREHRQKFKDLDLIAMIVSSFILGRFFGSLSANNWQF